MAKISFILIIFSIVLMSASSLTTPIVDVHSKTTSFRIGMIADLDAKSKRNKDDVEYSSFMKKGWLIVFANYSTFKFKWDEEESKEVRSGYAYKGRGMELSELVTFNGKLYSVDDRTGIVFELINDTTVLPWIILSDSETIPPKGFKNEWATIKYNEIYIGSHGKEQLNSNGELENNSPKMVKVVNQMGQVKTLNWTRNYDAIRNAVGISFPGYVTHESAAWSEFNKKWFFLPRKCSFEKYTPSNDELAGCNYLITTDEAFESIKVMKIGELVPKRGYSSFKFVPWTFDTIIMGIRTEEFNGSTSTYITVLDIKGNILHPDENVPTEYKYEGIEFI